MYDAVHSLRQKCKCAAVCEVHLHKRCAALMEVSGHRAFGSVGSCDIQAFPNEMPSDVPPEKGTTTRYEDMHMVGVPNRVRQTSREDIALVELVHEWEVPSEDRPVGFRNVPFLKHRQTEQSFEE